MPGRNDLINTSKPLRSDLQGQESEGVKRKRAVFAGL